MGNYLRKSNRGWLNKRLSRMKKTASTTELSGRLDIAERTLREWRASQGFEDAGIVSLNRDNRLVWNTERLRLWLIYRGVIRQPDRPSKRENPPLPTASEAQTMLWGN
jgi:hypothetical protein